VYIDSKEVNAAAESKSWARTGHSCDSAQLESDVAELIDGWLRMEKFIVVGISSDPIGVTPFTAHFWRACHPRLGGGNTNGFRGHLRFAELSGVRPMIETYPLERAQEAYATDDER